MSSFTFQSPLVFWLLVLVLPLGWVLARARRQRARVLEVMGGGLPTHRRLRDQLRLLAFCLLVLALARPGHSPRSESTSRTGRDVVFALDVSRSMLAQDATPSRLEVAKQAIRDALQTFSNERVGLVVYAGSASIFCPLSYDYGFVRYMLDQAHTRSVDFGGTMLQAAVEKVVDQVFIAGRGGVQDLIVLTDGGDHGSQIPHVLELLDEHAVDALLVGLGDPNQSSTIPIADVEGHVTGLEDDGATVYTKLDDASLRSLAAQSGSIQYVAAGTHAFNLGQVYADYAADKQIDVVEETSSSLHYQEAAAFFLVPSILLLLFSERWGARGIQLGLVLGSAIFFGHGSELSAANSAFKNGFDSALQLMQDGAYAEAEAQLGTLYQEAPQIVDARELAVVQFNRGLCFLKLSAAKAEAEPGSARMDALNARAAFLVAKRSAPELARAGIRLDSTAVWLAYLQKRIEAQQEAEQALNDELQALVERLEALLEAQQILRHSNAGNTRKSSRPSPTELVQAQEIILLESAKINAQMQELDRRISEPLELAVQTDSILNEPLKLMSQVKNSQLKTQELLANADSWKAARASSQSAERAIEAIIDLLAVDSGASSDEGDESDDFDEYDYYDDMNSSEESMNTSEPMQGDFAAGSEMQELPVPNYSTEDILIEEQTNLQFRQQQRASANAAKVEKDY
jgi:Ca-activated chloride channel family protein